MNPPPIHVHEFGDFRVDAARRRLSRRDGTPVPLTPRVFDTLLFLLEHHDTVLDKERLMEAVWPDSIVEENNLSQNISSLRRVFGDSPGSHDYIVTVPGRGYRFVAEVTTSDKAGAPGNGAEPASKPAMAQTKGESVAGLSQLNPALRTGKRRGVVVARSALLIIVLLLLIGALVYQRRQLARATQTSKVPDKSIAVLPFENRSEDKANAYFADGIQDEILTRLSKIADLKVISRTSTQHYKSAPEDLPEIARRLGVAYILEGSVQKHGDAVRVNVQLIKAANDSHLWADTYDRGLADVFAIQSDIAQQIATQLQAKLTGSEKSAIAKRPTADPAVYELYLKGQYEWNKHTQEDVQKAIDYYNQALEKDPNYALAYGGLSACYGVLGNNYLPPNETFPKAKDYAAKALAIDGSLAEAHLAMGAVRLYYDWDWAEAEKELKRAQTLDPNNAAAHHLYGDRLEIMGRFDEAKAERKRALELDPLSPLLNWVTGATSYLAGQYDEAIAQLEKTINLEPRYSPTYFQLGQAYEQKKMYAEAIATFQKGMDRTERNPQLIASLGHAYALSGERDKALKVLDELREMSKQRYISPYLLAIVYVGLGDKDQSFAWLDKAYQDRSDALIWLKVEPLFDSLRDDRRFQELLRRVHGE